MYLQENSARTGRMIGLVANRLAHSFWATALLTILAVPSVTAQSCVPAPPGLVSWWPAEGSLSEE